jgi:hypothetical protein
MANGFASKPPPMPQAWYDFNKSNDLQVVSFTEGPSLTRQEFAEDCDINVLMKRFENRDIGAIMRSAQEPVYYDLASAPSTLMDYMQLMQDADKAFMTLSAQVRREFDNDPVRFVDFASDPANLDQMRNWGLAPPAPAPEPVVAPPAPASAVPVPPGSGGSTFST